MFAYSYVRFSHADQLLGDSERRQTEVIERYAKDKSLTLDDSIRPDKALSAFRGKQRTKGHLADFLKKVASGEVKRGSALIVESLDRLSREEPEEAYDFLRELLRAGIEVHTVDDNEVYRRGEMDEFRIFKALLTQMRSSQESKRKSERCSQAAVQLRKRIREGKCVTERLPMWLTGTKGDVVSVIPERAEVIKRIYQMSADGMGDTRICEILIKGETPCWTTNHNKKKRWSSRYVGSLLRNKSTTGYFQPGTHPRGGIWTAEGEPILDYFPRIIEDDLFARVQVLRSKRFGRGLVEVGKYHGNGGRSNWHNLFLRLVRDQEGNSMIYQSIERKWNYLHSSDKQLSKTNRIRYDYFKSAILQMLDDLDWSTLISPVKKDDNILEQQLSSLTLQIKELERLKKRYLQVIESDTEMDAEMLSLFNENKRQLVELNKSKQSVTNQIKQSVPTTLTGIPTLIFNIINEEESKEYQLRLRDEVRKRIESITIHFGMNIVSAPNANQTIHNIPIGKGKTVAKVYFTNGAERWAVIEKDRTVILNLNVGEWKPI